MAEDDYSSSAKDFNGDNTPYGMAIRSKVYEWLKNVPEDVQRRILGQYLDSDSENEFHGAILELVMHQSLRELGYFTQTHPAIAGVAAAPDFLAEFKDGERIYVEATVNHYSGVFSGRRQVR